MRMSTRNTTIRKISTFVMTTLAVMISAGVTVVPMNGPTPLHVKNSKKQIHMTNLDAENMKGKMAIVDR